MPCGSKRAIRCPSPGFEKDTGKGDAVMMSLSMHGWDIGTCKQVNV